MASVLTYGRTLGMLGGKVKAITSANLLFQTQGVAFLQWLYNSNDPTAPVVPGTGNGYLSFQSSIPNNAIVNYGDGTITTYNFTFYQGAYYLVFSSQNGQTPSVPSGMNPLSNHVFTDGYSGTRGVNVNISNPSGIVSIQSVYCLWRNEFPSEISFLNNINTLTFEYPSYITQFPYSWINLKSLTQLSLSAIGTLLSQYPSSFLGFASLSNLSINNVCDFSNLDTSNARLIGNYGNTLTNFDLQSSRLTDIPIEWSNLTSLVGLDIDTQQWTAPPTNLNNLSTTITVLEIGGGYSFDTLMTGWGDFSNLINIYELNCGISTSMTTSLPTWFNKLTKLKFFGITGTYGNTQARTDTFTDNMYSFIVSNASMTTGNTAFRNMTITAYVASEPSFSLRPSGTYQQPVGYVQGTNNGTPASPLEEIWVMTNQYGHIWIINP